MIVDEGEQEGLATRDHGAVERIAGPPVVRRGGLEPAERPWWQPVRAGVQLQPGEVPLQGALARGGPGRGQQDRADLCRSAGRDLPLQRGRQLQHRRGGAWFGAAGRGQQRVEPASTPQQDPTVQRDPRDTDPPSERAGVLTLGEVPDQPTALPARQGRIGSLTDQGVTEQPNLPGPVSATVPVVVTPYSAGHPASCSSVITTRSARPKAVGARTACPDVNSCWPPRPDPAAAHRSPRRRTATPAEARTTGPPRPPPDPAPPGHRRTPSPSL